MKTVSLIKPTSSSSSEEGQQGNSSVAHGQGADPKAKNTLVSTESIPSGVKVVTGIVQKGALQGLIARINGVDVKILLLAAEDFNNSDALRTRLEAFQQKGPEDIFSYVRIEAELYAKKLKKFDTTVLKEAHIVHDTYRSSGKDEDSYAYDGFDYVDISSFLAFIQDSKNADISALIEVVSLADYDPEICKQLVKLPNLKTLNFKQTAGYVEILDFSKLEELNLGEIQSSKFHDIGFLKEGNAPNLKQVLYRVASPKAPMTAAVRGRGGGLTPRTTSAALAYYNPKIDSIDRFNHVLKQRAESKKEQTPQPTTTTTTSVPSTVIVPESSSSSAKGLLMTFLILILALGIGAATIFMNQSENK